MDKISNISNNDAKDINETIKILMTMIYKKVPTHKLAFDKLHIIYPQKKTYILDIKYLKNAKNILNFYFANIDKKPFINADYNAYAFQALWLLLVIIDNIHGINQKVAYTPMQINNIKNMINFGKYVFSIPKYKKFEFDVVGDGLATLKTI